MGEISKELLMESDYFLGKLFDMLVENGILSPVKVDEFALSLKVKKVKDYINRLQNIQEKTVKSGHIGLLKKMYYDKYVIKPNEVSDLYLHFLEYSYLMEKGKHINLVNPTDPDELKLKDEYISELIEKQKNTLDTWIDYMMSSESDDIEMWAKIWAFQGMLTMGNFNLDTKEYHRRSKDMMLPFVELDVEILKKCVELLKSYLVGNTIADDLKDIVSTYDFSKLYGTLVVNKANDKVELELTGGKWVKYDSNDIKSLYDSLKDFNIGPCSNYSFLSKMLVTNGYSCYVYYSADENNECMIPRICFFGSQRDDYELEIIHNIYGLYNGKYVEEEYEPVLRDKLSNYEFLTLKGYFNSNKITNFVDVSGIITSCRSSRIFSDIEEKMKNNVSLTKGEVALLYDNAKYFTFFVDDVHERIKSERDFRTDLGIMYEEESCISSSLTVPDNVISFNDFVFPKNSTCYISMNQVIEMKNVVFPEKMKEGIYLKSLVTAENVTFPKTLYCSLQMPYLIYANNVKFPNEIHGNFELSSRFFESLSVSVDVKYKSADLEIKNTVLPKRIYGDFLLSEGSLKGVILPEYVQGSVFYGGKKVSLDFLRLIQIRDIFTPGFISKKR